MSKRRAKAGVSGAAVSMTACHFLGATVICQVVLSIVWQSRCAETISDASNRRSPRVERIEARVRVDQVLLHGMAPYPCATLDWWPADKCDGGDCAWRNASILTADLSDRLLINAVKALSPMTLRVGGSLADQVIYAGVPGVDDAVSPRHCDGLGFARDDGRRIGFRGGCLPWARWTALLDFCQSVGCHVLFSVNALHGRTRDACPVGTACRRLKATVRPSCCTSYAGAWSSANLRALLRATAAAGYHLAGLAFGNELVTDKGIEAHLPADEYAREVLEFGSAVRGVWPSRGQRPLLLAPDANSFDEEWFGAFLSVLFPLQPSSSSGGGGGGGGGGPLDYVSHHMYPLGAGDGVAIMHAKVLDPRKLETSISDRLRKASQTVRNKTRGQARLCVSETGGAYNSGQSGVTDSFASSFWWLDLIGNLAKHGHDFACRQTLIGGHYALLDLQRRQPKPDFFATLLHRRLFGPHTLRASKLWPKGGGVNGTHNASGGGGGGGTVSSSSSSGSSSSSAAVAVVAEGGVVTDARASLAMLRVYAACAAPPEHRVTGGVVVLLINLSSESRYEVLVELGGQQRALSASGDPDGTRVSRLDFVVSADALSSQTVRLNGAELRAEPDGALPVLEGEPHVGRRISVPPISFGYFVFPEAANAQCTVQEVGRVRNEPAAAGVAAAGQSPKKKLK